MDIGGILEPRGTRQVGSGSRAPVAEKTNYDWLKIFFLFVHRDLFVLSLIFIGHTMPPL
jgi:hypothetical protein